MIFFLNNCNLIKTKPFVSLNKKGHPDMKTQLLKWLKIIDVEYCPEYQDITFFSWQVSATMNGLSLICDATSISWFEASSLTEPSTKFWSSFSELASIALLISAFYWKLDII